MMLPLLPGGCGWACPHAPDMNAGQRSGTLHGASHHAGVADDQPITEPERALCIEQGKRLAEFAVRLSNK